MTGRSLRRVPESAGDRGKAKTRGKTSDDENGITKYVQDLFFVGRLNHFKISTFSAESKAQG